MKKHSYFLKIFITLLITVTSYTLYADADTTFWNKQRVGANFFNHKEIEGRYKVAKSYKLDFVRLNSSKLSSQDYPNVEGSFLVGDKSDPQYLPIKNDIIYLKTIINMAKKFNIKVVLSLSSLPNSYWSNYNKGQIDYRIWSDFKTQDQIIEFWKEIALEFTNHPSIVGFSILNAPSPEFYPKNKLKNIDDYQNWYKSVENTPQDINLFYSKVIKAIRSVNKDVPIIISAPYYANPIGFQTLKVQKDPNVIYSFNMYDPMIYTSVKNQNQYSYPGKLPKSKNSKEMVQFNKQYLYSLLNLVADFQKQNNIDSNHILVSEFGVTRTNPGATKYIQDLISIFNENKWNWAFYSFREDDSNITDYELGTDNNLPFDYWQNLSNTNMPTEIYNKYSNNPLWKVILDGIDEVSKNNTNDDKTTSNFDANKTTKNQNNYVSTDTVVSIE